MSAPQAARPASHDGFWGRLRALTFAVASGRPLVRHLIIALACGVVLLIVTYQLDPYTNYELAAVAFYAIAAAGLNVLTGVNGQLSLGNGALMAVGAYTTALLLNGVPAVPLLGVLVAAVVMAAAAGAIVGLAAARLRGPYVAGATLALALALPELAIRFSGQFGGEEGLTVPPPPVPAFLGANFPDEQWLAWLSLLSAIVTFVLLANLLRSSVGRAFKAVRDNEVAARLAGINVARTQVLAFVVSAACAGLAGSLFALWDGLAAPAAFSLNLSLQLLTAIVIGGLGSLAGAVWGSAVLVVLPALTSNLTSGFGLPTQVGDNLPLAIYGVVLVLVMLLFPTGIQGALTRITGGTPWRHLWISQEGVVSSESGSGQ